MDTPHLVSKSEITEIESKGFEITGGNISFHDFINEHFSGFGLGDYIKAIDNLLGPLTQTRIEKQLAFFETPPPMLLMQYFSDDFSDDKNGLALSQALVKHDDQLVAELDYLRIPMAARKRGITKQLLNINLQQYLLLGVDKIKLEAALENGGLVWAKAFFTATEPVEVKSILDKAEQLLSPLQFKYVKRVYDNYYEQYPDGKAFPMVKWSELDGMDAVLTGSRWHGEIDLNNSSILTKFRNYVA